MNKYNVKITPGGGIHLVEFRLADGEAATHMHTCLRESKPFHFARFNRPELDELSGEWFVSSVSYLRDYQASVLYVIVKVERLQLLNVESALASLQG